ncbi:MAG: DNA translocase FtsK 4TM domain-containing protein [Akkermansia sp.]|nr:DNA translocase FtsK 4TM domain-containing protein [Akkermansia sp.]
MNIEPEYPTNPPTGQVKSWPTRLVGAGIVTFCILLIISLLTYNINEMGWAVLNPSGHESAKAVPCTNLLGNVGLYMAGLTYSLLGAASIYSLILLSVMGLSMLAHPLRTRLGRWIALLIMVICTCAFLSIQPWFWTSWAQALSLKSPGGLLGYFDGNCIIEPLLGAQWGMVLVVLGHAIALIYFARETPGSIGKFFAGDIRQLYLRAREKRNQKQEIRQQQEQEWKTSTPQPGTADITTPEGFDIEYTDTPETTPRNRQYPRFGHTNQNSATEQPDDNDSDERPAEQPTPVAQQPQLPQRTRPAIQTAPPPIRPHTEQPTPRPAQPTPKRDPFNIDNRTDATGGSNLTPVPTATRRPDPAPNIPKQTPRPGKNTPHHMSAGDNLLDLMPEVEDEIVRQNTTDFDDEQNNTPRSRMPLSPAAQAAYQKFLNPDTDNPTKQPEQNKATRGSEPIWVKQSEITASDDDIETPPPSRPITPLIPKKEQQPTPQVTPQPRADRPGLAEKLRNTPQPPQELPEDTRDMYEDYPLPPYDLLNYRPPAEEDTAAAREEMYATQQNIIETFASFKIDVGPGDITRGPSITRYEFYPPKGLKLSRISNLADNLRMATQSKSINILAPIPGKNTVGIELENEIKSPVYLRELLQSEAFHSPKLRIPVALGKDVYGSPVIGDLAAMPHTLVAGTTGSGKSVCVNSMILSMLYKFRPDELRLILVDPKVVEMQPYKKLPHLACPVVTNAARVIGALRWAVNEMEHRYKLFSKIGVRNFEDFNNRPEDYIPEPEEEEVQEYNSLPDNFDAADAIVRDIENSQGSEYLPEEEEQGEFDFDADEQIPAKLPYIVIIIDELADLMMQVKEDLENYIARLTQKARAAGIHLVAATQTPRANVITGIIKANIPSRLAFKVASPLDSRVILDANGGENLLGKGDFLFLPPGGITKITRAQGAFVSDPEIASIVKFCASHAKQNFVQGVTAEMNNAEGGSADAGDGGGRLGGNGMSDEDAELYTRCVNLVITERKASTSMLQRRFSIGYGRAAKMMDMMEARGVIGPASGNTSRPREVLIEAPE